MHRVGAPHLHERRGRELGDGLADLRGPRNAAEHGVHAGLDVAVAVESEGERQRGPRRLLDLCTGGWEVGMGSGSVSR